MSRPGAEMKAIDLTLTVDELNLILEGIGQLPFVRVYALVAKLQKQAQEQLTAASGEAPDAK